MVNFSAEVVGQVETLINFCPNMVRFRIRPEFFFFFFFIIIIIYFFFFCYFCILVFDFFLLLSLLLYKLNLKLCVILDICLFLMLSNEM